MHGDWDEYWVSGRTSGNANYPEEKNTSNANYPEEKNTSKQEGRTSNTLAFRTFSDYHDKSSCTELKPFLCSKASCNLLFSCYNIAFGK